MAGDGIRDTWRRMPADGIIDTWRRIIDTWKRIPGRYTRLEIHINLHGDECLERVSLISGNGWMENAE